MRGCEGFFFFPLFFFSPSPPSGPSVCVRSGAGQDEAAVGAEWPGELEVELEVKLQVEPLVMDRRACFTSLCWKHPMVGGSGFGSCWLTD